MDILEPWLNNRDQMKDNFLVIECQHCDNSDNDKHLFVPQWCYDWLISVQIYKTGYIKNYTVTSCK